MIQNRRMILLILVVVAVLLWIDSQDHNDAKTAKKIVPTWQR
ncbi:MAG: hypothetical protein Q8R29_03760 [bacterium]|nr:hypothetical protein [bacterium]